MESNDSLAIPDKRETSDIPGLPSGPTTTTMTSNKTRTTTKNSNTVHVKYFLIRLRLFPVKIRTTTHSYTCLVDEHVVQNCCQYFSLNVQNYHTRVIRKKRRRKKDVTRTKINTEDALWIQFKNKTKRTVNQSRLWTQDLETCIESTV